MSWNVWIAFNYPVKDGMHQEILRNLRFRLAGRTAWDPALNSRIPRQAESKTTNVLNRMNTFARHELLSLGRPRGYARVLAMQLIFGGIAVGCLPTFFFHSFAASLSQSPLYMTAWAFCVVAAIFVGGIHCGKAVALHRRRTEWYLVRNLVVLGEITNTEIARPWYDDSMKRSQHPRRKST